MKKFCMAITKERKFIPDDEIISTEEIIDEINSLLENIEGIELIKVVQTVSSANVYSIHLLVADDKVDILNELYYKITTGKPFQEPFEEKK